MHTDAKCLDCGYLLRGLSDPRCPECGRPFSPDDPWSVNCGRPYGRRIAWILRPTHWIAPAAPWVAWGLFAISALMLCDRLLPLTILALIWIIFLLPYAVRGSMRNLAVRFYRQPRALKAVDRAGVRKIFLHFTISFGLMLSGLPMHFLFYLSLPWINHVAQRAYDGPIAGPYPPPEWAGIYRITIVDVPPRSVTARIGGVELTYYPGKGHELVGWYPWEMIPLGGGWFRSQYNNFSFSRTTWGW